MFFTVSNSSSVYSAISQPGSSIDVYKRQVIGHGGDAVKAALEDENVKFAIQEKQLGTGHAVMQAGDFIEDNADILVLYGDTPLLSLIHI